MRQTFHLGRGIKQQWPFRLEEDEVAHLEFSTEGTMLDGGEEIVEFSKLGAIESLLLFDGFDEGGKAVLETDG